MSTIEVMRARDRSALAAERVLDAFKQDNANTDRPDFDKDMKKVMELMKGPPEGFQLKTDMSSDSIQKNGSVIPENKTLQNHIWDIQQLAENRDNNPEFKTDLIEKMVETNKAIGRLGEKISDLKRKGAITPDHIQVESTAEMFLKLLEILFGKSSNLSPEDKQGLRDMHQDLEKMHDRVNTMDAYLKGWSAEQAAERDAANEGPSPKMSR